MLTLDPSTTALVMIDLQKGIMNYPLAPHASAAVMQGARELATKFRAAGAPVVWVTVELKEAGPEQPVDRPMPRPAGGYPAEWTQLAEGLALPGDLHVVKHNWGAFHETDLDAQLKAQGVQTVVLGGVATNMGVESTARQGRERGYALVIAEDLNASMSAELHQFAIQNIFPLISRVVQSGDISLAKA